MLPYSMQSHGDGVTSGDSTDPLVDYLLEMILPPILISRFETRVLLCDMNMHLWRVLCAWVNYDVLKVI